MGPETAFSKAVFSFFERRAPACIRGAAYTQTTMRARPGWVPGAEALRTVPGRGLSMARGGPEFDCGQPRRHPFSAKGGPGPAEVGPRIGRPSPSARSPPWPTADLGAPGTGRRYSKLAWKSFRRRIEPPAYAKVTGGKRFPASGDILGFVKTV